MSRHAFPNDIAVSTPREEPGHRQIHQRSSEVNRAQRYCYWLRPAVCTWDLDISMDTSGPCLPLMLLSYAHCSPDPNSFVSGNPGSPPPPRQQVRSVQKEIRQQERVLLDVFSTTNFMKASPCVAVPAPPLVCKWSRTPTQLCS